MEKDIIFSLPATKYNYQARVPTPYRYFCKIVPSTKVSSLFDSDSVLMVYLFIYLFTYWSTGTYQLGTTYSHTKYTRQIYYSKRQMLGIFNTKKK